MKVFDQIAPRHIEFITQQKLFFVASAPLSETGHVNLSPKGYDSFAVIDEHRVAFIDYGGSGSETIAHLKENGRLTIMFTAFDGKPLILRLYGKGQVHHAGSEGFQQLLKQLPQQDCAARSIIELKVTRVQESCGWSVPVYQYVGERDTLRKYIQGYGEDAWLARRREKNKTSIDGLPALGQPE